MEAIADLEEQPIPKFTMELAIDEATYRGLHVELERLTKKYNRLLFNSIIKERADRWMKDMKEKEDSGPYIEAMTKEFNADNISEDYEKAVEDFERKMEKRVEEKVEESEKDGKIFIDVDDLF